MNKIPVVVIVLGIILILAGILIILNIEDDATETIEEGYIYEGSDGEMNITGENDTKPHLYVHIKSKFVGGKTGGYNERHGDNTWNLTEKDCEKVKTFTLTRNSTTLFASYLDENLTTTNVSFLVYDSRHFSVGDEIQIDSEVMLITATHYSSLWYNDTQRYAYTSRITVERAYQNTVAETHNLSSNITIVKYQVFMPRCNYVEDIAGDDEWIVVGTLCKQWDGVELVGSGCPDGTYTWDSKGKEVMVYDGDMLGKMLGELFRSLLGSFGAICCGVVLLLIGIILAFTMADPQDTYMGDNQDSNLFNQAAAETGVKSASGWDDQEDYIRKEKTEEVEKTKEEAPETDQKKGEYNIPPPE